MSRGCVTIAIVALLAVAPHVALAKPAKRAAHPAAKKAPRSVYHQGTRAVGIVGVRSVGRFGRFGRFG